MRREILTRIHRRTPVQSADFNFGTRAGLRRRILELEKLRRLIRAAEQSSETSHNDNAFGAVTAVVPDPDFDDSVWFGG